MNQSKLVSAPAVLLISLSLAYVGYLFYTLDELPVRMASHFGFDGQANGWMSRFSYLAIMLVFGLGLAWVLASISLIFRWVPDSAINLPHKDYWLAPERRAETTALLARQMQWFACLELGLMFGLHALTLQANRQAVPQMSNLAWLLIGLFVAGTAIWLVSIFRRFGRPPAPTA